MGLYRDDSGLVFETDDAFARTHGYTPVSATGEYGLDKRAGLEQHRSDLGKERGIVGDINAAGTGFLSGATMGASDFALGHLMSDNEREQLQAEIGEHPWLHEGGNAVGVLGTALAVPGSAAARTPTGYLAATAGRAAEEALAEGGVAGTAKAVGIMGTEGALQSGGQYLGSAALEDKETTAEGLAGALGAGFAFGAGGGAAVLGISNGAIAARKLYSRVMDGGKDAAKVAEMSWSLKSEEQLTADTATADVAKQRLDDIRRAKVEALKYKQQTKSMAREEQMRASAAGPQAEFIPEPPELMKDAEGTPIVPRAMAKDLGYAHGTPLAEPAIPALPAASVEAGGTQVIPRERAQLSEGAGPDYSVPERIGSTPRERRGDFGPGYMGEGPGLKDKLASDIHNSRVANEIPKGEDKSIENWINDIVDHDATQKPLSHYGGAQNSLEAKMERTLAEMRKTKTTELLGKEIAGEEERLIEALTEFERDKGGFLDIITRDAANQGAFVDEVHGAARKAEKFGDRKSFVSSVHERYAVDHPEVSLEQFKSRLLTEQKAGAIKMSRADFVAAMDPELVAASHTTNGVSDFHFVEAPPKTGRSAEVLPKTGTPRDFLESANPKSMVEGDMGRLRSEQATGVGKGGKARAILDNAHEAALERVQHADTPEARGIAMQEADRLEQLLEKLTPSGVQRDIVPRDQFAGEIHADARAIDSYEKSSAKLAEAVGDAAHPTSQAAAKGYSEAADDAVRKVQDRSARAVDDHETFGPHEEYGPRAATPKERVHYAKERYHEADSAYTSASNEEASARDVYSKAQAKVTESNKSKKAAGKIDAKAAKDAERAARTAKHVGNITALGGAAEILDIPGLPKASDLPVIGPLVGAYLKYRLVKTAMGRAAGRVPALADNRVAALAARTKDRIGRAIDRSLGLIDKAAGPVRKVIPGAAGIVAQRIFDDGREPPPKGAGIQEHAVARIQELAAYVTTPNAIENDVRRELANVMDPDIIAAAEKQRRAAMEWLLNSSPKMPDRGPLQNQKWQIAPAAAMSFVRKLDAINDPAGVYERLSEKQALIALEAAEALRNVYPQMFALGQQRLLQRAGEAQNVPYRQRVQMSLAFGLPLDTALSADNLKISQSTFVKTPPAPPVGAAPPMPAIAGQTNMNPLYLNPLDKQR